MLRNVIAVGALLLVSCAAERSSGPSSRLSSEPPAAVFTPAAATQATPPPINREGCPAPTGGTRVGAENVDGGAALVFTTSEDIAALRVRVTDMAMPIAMQKAERRIDNIHQGVRLVFEASDTKDVAATRRAVEENARRIALMCGLVLGSPPNEKAAPAASTGTQKTPPKSQDDSKSKESDAEKTKRDAAKNGQPAPAAHPKDESKVKPKETEKPKEAEKPPQPEKPKDPNEPDKPKPPPPPDAPPGPILPRPQAVLGN